MNEKISINVLLPGMNLSHHFLVPGDMILRDVLKLVLQLLMEEYPGVDGLNRSGASLLQASTGLILDNTSSLNKMKLIEGEPLILLL